MRFMPDTEHAGLRGQIVKSREEAVGRRIRQEGLDHFYCSTYVQ